VVEVDVRVDDDRRRRRYRLDRGGDVGQAEPGVDKDAPVRAADEPAQHVTRLGHKMHSRLDLGDVEPVPRVGRKAAKGHSRASVTASAFSSAVSRAR